MATTKALTPIRVTTSRTAAAAAALEEMPDALRAVHHEIVAVLNGAVEGTLLAYRRIGEIADQIRDEAKYGTGPIPRLGESLQMGANTIFTAIRFANAYKEDEVKQIAKMRTANGRSVSWTHVAALLNVPDDKARKEFLKLTVEHSWTADDLAAAIHKKFGKRGNGGRKHIVPKSPMAGLQQMSSVFQQVCSRQTEVWDKIFDAAADIPPDRMTPEFLETVNSAMVSTEALSDKATAALHNLKGIRTRVERVLSKRKPADE